MKRLPSMAMILLISMAVVILAGSMRLGTVSAEVSQAQILQLASGANGSSSGQASECSPNNWAALVVCIILGAVYGIGLTFLWTRNGDWKLSEALSEVAIFVPKNTDGASNIGSLETATKGLEQATKGLEQATKGLEPATEALKQATEALKQATEALKQATEALKQATEAKPQLVASSSRLLAFIGSIIISGMLLASSFYIVWRLFNCQSLEPLSNLGTYLTSSAALFIPYIANKVGDIFKPLSK
ncbi:hypothetical protein H6G74_28905 [Nostoc spongiaeforme FACHB-130]|uniref:Uncharacterized protein n=1 Tax=Nostoc spongiaeforme FACHB-130 TaxID=1357510 RepID=A0ABR8G4Y7_9NOSO|nr:hypothetical protein [Nostoc spongiaeforme]MBD2598316.1 hypothetical protein [Nostoc spongiaeforme FACHB-130]